MKYVMAVTNDKYEFPVYIEESYYAMSKKTGIPHVTIMRQCKGLTESTRNIKFVEVENDD